MNSFLNTSKFDTDNKICAVIPFFNEEKTIKDTVNEVLRFVDFVIAVNDGSSDSSQDKIKNIDKVIILKNDFNLGKGKALLKGFTESIKLNSKYTITIDADLQHNPKCIPDFIDKINNYDIVIGNRLHDLKNMPLHRRLSNLLTSFLLSKKTKINIIDSQCGYRIFKTPVLKNILPDCQGFEAESEMIVKAARNNYKIGFTDIPVIYGNDNSKMKSLQAIKGFLKIMLM